MQYYGPRETVLAMTYGLEALHTDTSLALLWGLDATCHICAHVGKPETTLQYTCSQEEEKKNPEHM